MALDSKSHFFGTLFFVFNYFILYIFFPFVVILNVYILVAKTLGLNDRKAKKVNERIENLLMIAIVIYLYLIMS